MSSFGVTEQGFVEKSLAQIIADLEDAERLAFGAAINLLPSSVGGQLNGVFGDALKGNWSLANAVYQSWDPEAATGAALDRIAAITGITRLPATKSTMTSAGSNPAVCTGTPATSLLVGRVVSVGLSADRFVSTAAATLTLLTSWAPLTAYSVGDQRTNGGSVYQVSVAGTSAASGGPSGTGDAIVDGTVTWRFAGTGTAAADVDFEAEEFGVVAAASAVLAIETPVSGWDGAKNMADATAGVDLETDAALRTRRLGALRAQGDATVESILADLIDPVSGPTGVTEAFVFENDTIITDGAGRPPKSVECVVRGGTDADVARQIFESKGAGILTFGFPGSIVTEVVVDSQGFNHTIEFSRPTDVPIWIDITVSIDAAAYAGDTALRLALVAAGDEQAGLGADVIVLAIQCATLEVSGVLDVTAFIIDTQAIPPGTNEANIPIQPRELATYDTSRIDIVTV